MIAVIERFRAPGRTFLMPPSEVALTSETVIDISHESLMRTWKRLIEWVGEEARSAQIYLQLSKAAGRYQEGKTGLYRDPELQIAVNWREKTQPTATWAERYDVAFERAMLFLSYSEKEAELEIAEKERQRRKQLAMARRVMIGSVIAGVVILLFALNSMVQRTRAEQAQLEAEKARQVAEEKRQEAERQKLEVEKQRTLAEEQREKAVQEQKRAEQQQRIAVEQRRRAEQEEARAWEQEKRAVEEKERAEQARREAERAQAEADRQRAKALEQKQLAEESEAEAQRLGKLALSRAVAAQTSRLRQEEQRDVAALLAVVSHRLYRAGEGRGEDPDVHRALADGISRFEKHGSDLHRDHADAVRAVALGPEGQIVWTGSDDGTVRRFDRGQPDAGSRLIADLGTEIRSLAVDAGGTRVAAGGLDGTIRLWSTDGEDAARDVARPTLDTADPGAPASGVYALAFSPRESVLASGDEAGNVALWDARSGEPVTVLSAQPAGRVHALSFDPAGETLAAAIGDRTLLWSMTGPRADPAGADEAPAAEAPRMLDSGRIVRSLAWTEDGSLLACGTDQGSILFWHPAGDGASPSRHMDGHQSAVTGLSFGHTSTLLASSSLDRRVMLWDLAGAEGEVEPIVLDNGAWVWSVALTPEDHHVLAASDDRRVRSWDTHTDQMAEEICALVGRNLKTEEWAEHMPPELPFIQPCPNQP